MTRWRANVIYLLLACFCLGAGYAWGKYSFDARFSDRDTVEIFHALLTYSGGIERKGCEPSVVGIDDFVASYLDRSLTVASSASRSFMCEGGATLQCSWSFGGGSSSEAWGRILKFDYDTALKRIRPGSVACLDVP